MTALSIGLKTCLVMLALQALQSGCAQAGVQAKASEAHVNMAANDTTARLGIRHMAPMSSHAKDHYLLLWGIEDLDVKAVESGQMIRFSYSTIDPAKAAALNDKKANPVLLDESRHVQLIVPTMEKVGQLRQTATPQAGNSYWMVFSNKGGVVKPGDRVNIAIGKFRAEGLYVR